MTYIDKTKTRARQRVYERNAYYDKWLPIAEEVINNTSGAPEAYDFILEEIYDKDQEFIMTTPYLESKYGVSSKRSRRYIDQMCQWGLLEVVGKTSTTALIYKLTIPIKYR